LTEVGSSLRKGSVVAEAFCVAVGGSAGLGVAVFLEQVS
jgi:hypothetical protein